VTTVELRTAPAGADPPHAIDRDQARQAAAGPCVTGTGGAAVELLLLLLVPALVARSITRRRVLGNQT